MHRTVRYYEVQNCFKTEAVLLRKNLSFMSVSVREWSNVQGLRIVHDS